MVLGDCLIFRHAGVLDAPLLPVLFGLLWSDVALMTIITLGVGFVFGLMPLYSGHIAACFVLQRISVFLEDKR